MSRKKLDDSWMRIQSHIRSLWGDNFSEDEMKKARGSLHKMVHLIHEKTGENQASIRQKITSIV